MREDGQMNEQKIKDKKTKCRERSREQARQRARQRFSTEVSLNVALNNIRSSKRLAICIEI